MTYSKREGVGVCMVWGPPDLAGKGSDFSLHANCKGRWFALGLRLFPCRGMAVFGKIEGRLGVDYGRPIPGTEWRLDDAKQPFAPP